MIVMKFGGTSVEDAKAIERTAAIVKGRLSQKPVVLVSAMAKVTDQLLAMGRAAGCGDRKTALKLSRALRERPLSDEELTNNSEGAETKQASILRKHALTRETPLWYYILKESEVRHNGNRVGPVGSRLVAETIYAALRGDRPSLRLKPGAGAALLVGAHPDVT